MKSSKQTCLNRCSRVFLIIIGAICVLCSTHIINILPELLGSAMVFSAGGMLLDLLRLRAEFKEHPEYSDGIARAILLLLLGCITIVQRDSALVFIGVSWGILGLIKGGRSLAAGLLAAFQNATCAALFLIAAVQIGLAFALIFYPAEKIQIHMILLGLQIIFFAATRATGVSYKTENVEKETAPQQPLLEQSDSNSNALK